MAKKMKIAEEDLAIKQRKFAHVAYNLEEIPADKFLKDNFLPYAWSYNLDRALVDMSGLKPVQRRILYTMFEDGLSPASHRSKVATLAGRVLSYHPHGDSSVVDALKNLARDHIFRVPLIDGKGDFGSPGRPGAAPRYIEARLNRAAWLNVEELKEHAVPMVPSYDGSKTEPLKLPVRWPVAVINGGAGIAIAYASSMPSHNPTEIMNACRALLKDPLLSDENLMRIIKGPDFNMGGTITSMDGIREYITTGKGSFRIRGNYEVKPGPRNSARIEFHELPFGFYPEKIIEQIQAQSEGGERFKDVASYKNLSDLKHPIRLVIETKANTNYKKTVAELFKYTSLETTFSANVTTIVDNRPKQSSIKELILEFIEFRKYCVRNKSTYNLGKRRDRLHLLEGLMKVLLDVDKAIAIIRSSEDTDAARSGLMEVFAIDEAQADYVLSLQLRRLTKMDRHELENEKVALEEEVKTLETLISEESALIEHLDQEFQETAKIIGDERKTEILALSAEEFNEQEKLTSREMKIEDKNLPCFISRFADGTLLRSLEPFAYEAGAKIYEHGPLIEQVKVKSQDTIVVVSSQGMGYRIPASYVRLDEGTDAAALGLASDLRIVALAKGALLKTDVGLLLGTRLGEVKLVKPDLPLKEEFPVFNLAEGDEIIDGRWVHRTLNGSVIVSVTKSSKVLVYGGDSLRAAGAPAGGVKSQKVMPGDEVVSFAWIPNPKAPDLFILSHTAKTLKLTPLADIPPKGKGSLGVVLHTFKKGEDALTTAYTGVLPVMVVEGMNNTIPTPPATKRAATGMDFSLPVVMGAASIAQ